MMRTLFISIYILHNHARSHNSAHSHTMRALTTTNTSMLHTDDCNCKCEHVLHTPYNTLHWLEIQCYEYTYSRWLPAKVTIIPLNNAFVLHWCFYECARWCPVRRISMMIFASHIIWVYRSGLELSTDKLQNLGYFPKFSAIGKNLSYFDRTQKRDYRQKASKAKLTNILKKN